MYRILSDQSRFEDSDGSEESDGSGDGSSDGTNQDEQEYEQIID